MNTTARNLLLAGPLALAFTLTAAPPATAFDHDGPVIVAPPSEPEPAPTDVAQPEPEPEPDPGPEGPDQVAQPDEPEPPQGPGDIAQPEDTVDPHDPGEIPEPEDDVDPAAGDEPVVDFPLDTDDDGDAELPGDEADLPTQVDAGAHGDAAAVDGDGGGGDSQGWLFAMAAAVLAAITAVMARFVRRS